MQTKIVTSNGIIFNEKWNNIRNRLLLESVVRLYCIYVYVPCIKWLKLRNFLTFQYSFSLMPVIMDFITDTDYHNSIAFTIMSGRIVIISRVTNYISMHHETGIRFNGERLGFRESSNFEIGTVPDEMFILPISRRAEHTYMVFIFNERLKRRGGSAVWKCTRIMYMYTYIQTQHTHTHTHTRSDLTGERDTSRNLWLRERTVGRRTEIGNASVEWSETLFVGLSTFPSATATMLALPWAAFIAQQPRRKNCPA